MLSSKFPRILKPSKLIFLLCLVASVTLNSCISNIVTGLKYKTKFTVTTNVEEPKVASVDYDEKVLPNNIKPVGKAGSIKVERTDFTQLNISKPGYQSRNVDILPNVNRPFLKVLDLTGGTVIGISGIVFQAFQEQPGNDLSRQGLSAKIIAVAATFYGLFNGVSGLWGGPNTLSSYSKFKNPNLDIMLYPDTAANPNKIDIVCDEVKGNFNIDQVLGNAYFFNLKGKEIKLKDTSDYRDNLEYAINNHLTKINLLRSFSSRQKSKSIFDKAIEPQYILKANLLSVSFNGNTLSKSEAVSFTSLAKANIAITTKAKIEWQVCDKLGRPIFTKIIEGWGQRIVKKDDDKSELSTNSMKDAIIESMNKLAFSEEFSKIIKTKKEVNKTSEKFTTKLLLAKPKAFSKGSKFISEASKSVVTIIRKDSHGSGSIISSDGYILTNAHVCGNDSILKIRFKNGDETTAKVFRMNMEEDLALLKFDNINKIDGLVMSADSNGVQFADEIYTIGTPADLSLNQSISNGLISGIRVIKKKKLYQTDAAINGGNSGGAMLDANGFLIGVPSSKIKGTGLEGLGFAIPSTVAFDALKISYK